MLKGFNDFIAVEPFKTNSVEAKGTGFAVIAQKTEFARLKVIVGDEKVPTGAYVYVDGDTCKQKFATEIRELNGQKCIAMPRMFVKFIETESGTESVFELKV